MLTINGKTAKILAGGYTAGVLFNWSAVSDAEGFTVTADSYYLDKGSPRPDTIRLELHFGSRKWIGEARVEGSVVFDCYVKKPITFKGEKLEWRKRTLRAQSKSSCPK